MVAIGSRDGREQPVCSVVSLCGVYHPVSLQYVLYADSNTVGVLQALSLNLKSNIGWTQFNLKIYIYYI